MELSETYGQVVMINRIVAKGRKTLGNCLTMIIYYFLKESSGSDKPVSVPNFLKNNI